MPHTNRCIVWTSHIGLRDLVSSYKQLVLVLALVVTLSYIVFYVICVFRCIDSIRSSIDFFLVWSGYKLIN